jgi:hypothetical protein
MRIVTYNINECLRVKRIATCHLIEWHRGMRVVTHLII